MYWVVHYRESGRNSTVEVTAATWPDMQNRFRGMFPEAVITRIRGPFL